MTKPSSPSELVRTLRDRWAARKLVRLTTRALVPPPARAFASYGRGALIVPPARIEDPQYIRIGEMVIIHEHVWLDVRRRDGDAPPTLVIGDRARLSRFVKIVSRSSVRLGNGALIADRVYCSDVEYVPGHADVEPAMRPLTEPRPVVIGDEAYVGVGAIIKPGVTIGERAYIAAGSVVAKDVPARAVAMGNPARVVRILDE